MSIKGYVLYLHKSKLNITGNYRRGLAIFYRSKHRFHITKVYSSKKYDIVWMRFDTPQEPLFFCFFYSPGSHHPLSVRTKYYDIFSCQYTRFASTGKVYLVGDTNARLGSLLNDRNLHGALTTNSNKPLFLQFLEYSGLVILNPMYSKGVPTYEIVGKKRSIIDFCLTNSPDTVCNFLISPRPFGVNSQTCHRALTTTIMVCPPKKKTAITSRKRTKYSLKTFEEQNEFAQTVSYRISKASSDYYALSKIFTRTKQAILAKRRISHKNPNICSATLNLQRRFSEAIEALQVDKTNFSLFVADNLEKLLNQQYEHEKKRDSQSSLRKWMNLISTTVQEVFSINSVGSTIYTRKLGR